MNKQSDFIPRLQPKNVQTINPKPKPNANHRINSKMRASNTRPRTPSFNDYSGTNTNRNMFDTFECLPTKSNYGNPATNRYNPDFTRLGTQQLNVSSHADLMENPTDDTRSLMEQTSTSHAAKFGTFDGVLGRCLLCMFGVILFLRMGWIVGHAGVFESSLVVLLSASITFLTTLSLCALVTNGDISHGGPYFVVSRTLGAEMGGVVGVLFAFGNAIGVALHLVGFAESVVALFTKYITGSMKWDIVFVAELSLFFLLGVAWNGVGWIIKMVRSLCLFVSKFPGNFQKVLCTTSFYFV